MTEGPLGITLPEELGLGIIWTVIFDTIYAHQDYLDDLKASVKGLAVRLGRKGTKPAYSILTAVQLYFSAIGGSTGRFWPTIIRYIVWRNCSPVGKDDFGCGFGRRRQLRLGFWSWKWLCRHRNLRRAFGRFFFEEVRILTDQVRYVVVCDPKFRDGADT